MCCNKMTSACCEGNADLFTNVRCTDEVLAEVCLYDTVASPTLFNGTDINNYYCYWSVF